MTLTLPEKIRKLSDKDWLDLLIKSVSNPVINGVEFPAFPSDDLQTQFVGSANEKTLKEAYEFYVLVKKYAKKLDKPLGRESRFLDFGCGWGRFLRFFWKDVDENNLFGCDVAKTIVDTCHDLKVPGQIDCIDTMGVLPYPDNYFDVIMAYSVFTHLPKDVHLHWMRELARVARPGSIFCLTLEPRRFMDFIANIPDQTDSYWYQLLSKHKSRLGEFYKSFDSGDFVFMPTNVGSEDTYGDAVVPLAFVKREWSAYFTVRDYIDDPAQFWQAVLVAQRG